MKSYKPDYRDTMITQLKQRLAEVEKERDAIRVSRQSLSRARNRELRAIVQDILSGKHVTSMRMQEALNP